MTQEEINQIECTPEVVDNKPCEHKNTYKEVIGGCWILDIVAVFCQDCGKQLTEAEYEF